MVSSLDAPARLFIDSRSPTSPAVCIRILRLRRTPYRSVSHHGQSTTHAQGLAGDVATACGGQESESRGNLARFARSLQRNVLDRAFDQFGADIVLAEH